MSQSFSDLNLLQLLHCETHSQNQTIAAAFSQGIEVDKQVIVSVVPQRLAAHDDFGEVGLLLEESLLFSAEQSDPFGPQEPDLQFKPFSH